MYNPNLYRSDQGDGPFVGKYRVDLPSFERTVLPLFTEMLKPQDNPSKAGLQEVVVIDEIGKMELFSHKFVSTVKELFSGRDKVVIMATVPLTKGKSLPLVTELKQRRDCKLFEVNTRSTLLGICNSQ